MLYSPGSNYNIKKESFGSNNNNQRPTIAVQHVLDIVEACSKINNSCIILFIFNFFKKCNEKGRFSYIINHFMSAILPNSHIIHGKDLIALFLGLTHSLNWILPAPGIFCEVLNELDAETKKLVLFQFKMEIEEYHDKNYLPDEAIIIRQVNRKFQAVYDIDPNFSEDNHTIASIPGKEWQSMRFDNIINYSNVLLPGFCDKCKSKRSFIIDIFSYLESLVAAHGQYPSRSISGKCSNCRQYSTSTYVMRLPYFVAAWQ